MIGVVLWKNTDDGSAVIWCEDQGDLAFMNSKDEVLDAPTFFDVGDVVEFDVLVRGNMRGVRNLSRLQDPSRPDLPTNLSAVSTDRLPQGAEIIQLSRKPKPEEANDKALTSRDRFLRI